MHEIITCCSSFEEKQSVEVEEKGKLCVLFVFNIIVTLSSFCWVRIVLIERKKKLVVLVQSILQLNRSRFLSLASTYTQLPPTARYISLVVLPFFCCCCCCRRCGKKSDIDKRLSIPSDKDNHLLRDEYYVKLFSSHLLTFSFFCSTKERKRKKRDNDKRLLSEAYLGFTE